MVSVVGQSLVIVDGFEWIVGGTYLSANLLRLTHKQMLSLHGSIHYYMTLSYCYFVCKDALGS